MIVCLRTVVVPPEWRGRYLAWIDAGRRVRQQHGILAELVCEPADGTGETVVITVWPSHEVFDALDRHPAPRCAGRFLTIWDKASQLVDDRSSVALPRVLSFHRPRRCIRAFAGLHLVQLPLYLL